MRFTLLAVLSAALVTATPVDEPQTDISLSLTAKADNLRLDANGVLHLGTDGVLRSLGPGRQVLDFYQLTNAEITALNEDFPADLLRNVNGILDSVVDVLDGTDVVNPEQLWNPGEDIVPSDVVEGLKGYSSARSLASELAPLTCEERQCDRNSDCGADCKACFVMPGIRHKICWIGKFP